VRVLTEFPERFKCGGQLYIEDQPYTITAAQPSKETVILRLGEIDTLETAELLRGKYLEIPLSERKVLPAGRYYHHEIIGLEVFTNTGSPLGQVREILSTGSNDVYVVGGHGRELLIPAVKDVIKEINIARSRIIIEVIDGLLG
jgi:16S rRNA processing protein RimM